MNIIRKINQFYKMAGLLNVPEKVLKEATDWIVGKYCYQMSKKFLEKIKQLRQRTKNIDQIKPQIKEWQEIYNLIYDIGHTSRKDNVISNVDQLEKMCATREGDFFDFPGFNPFEQDSDELNGIISENKQSLYISLIKNSDDNYGFMLTGKYKGKISDLDKKPIQDINFEIWEPEINSEGIQKRIKEILPQLEEIMIAMENLLGYYDTYGSQYINQFVMMYALCKKLSDKFPEQEYKDVKELELFAGDSKYTAKNFGKVDFFIDLEKHTEEHGGAWRPSQYKNNTYIGYFTVVGDPDHDFELMKDPKDLKNKIDKLIQTTRHEFQHTIQDFIAKINKLKEDGGLPSKNIRDKRIAPGGKPIDPDYPKELMDEKDESGRIQHRLRDVEFYNRLSDEVGRFKLFKTFIPLSLHKDFLRTWIDDLDGEQFMIKLKNELESIIRKQLKIINPKRYPSDDYIDDYDLQSRVKGMKYKFEPAITALFNGNHFFEGLKQYQPEKYRKAVIEFIKAVGL